MHVNQQTTTLPVFEMMDDPTAYHSTILLLNELGSC